MTFRNISDVNHHLEKKKISPNCILEFIHSSSSSLSRLNPPSRYLCNCPPQQTAHPRLKFLGALVGRAPPGLLSPLWSPRGVLNPLLVTPSSQQVAPWHPPRSSASLCKLGITISCTTTHLQQTIEVLFYTSILTIFKNNITISFVCITQL